MPNRGYPVLWAGSLASPSRPQNASLYRNPLPAQIGTLPTALTNSASQNCSYVRSRLVSSQEQACDRVIRASGARSGLYPGVSAYGTAGGESACTLVDLDIHATFAWPSPGKELLSSPRNRMLPDESFRSAAAGKHIFLCSRRVEHHCDCYGDCRPIGRFTSAMPGNRPTCF